MSFMGGHLIGNDVIRWESVSHWLCEAKWHVPDQKVGQTPEFCVLLRLV